MYEYDDIRAAMEYVQDKTKTPTDVNISIDGFNTAYMVCEQNGEDPIAFLAGVACGVVMAEGMAKQDG